MIKPCKKKDLDNRPLSEQKWCLYARSTGKLLGRHPSKEAAKAQEVAIQIHKHGEVDTMKKQIKKTATAGKYEVLVGNIGTVYSGGSFKEAQQNYIDYIKKSKANVGKAAGEDVTLLKEGEILKEHAGTQEKEGSVKKASPEEDLKKITKELQNFMSMLPEKSRQQALSYVNNTLTHTKWENKKFQPVNTSLEKPVNIKKLLEPQKVEGSARAQRLARVITRYNEKKAESSVSTQTKEKTKELSSNRNSVRIKQLKEQIKLIEDAVRKNS